MAFPGEIGWIGKNCLEHRIPLLCQVLRSNAGHFVGTVCPECQKEDPSPNSRESEYYETRQAAVQSMFDGTTRWRDTSYRGLAMAQSGKTFVFETFQTAETPWAVLCRAHGKVYLSEAEYTRQLSAADCLWTCPTCHCAAEWDDDNYEAHNQDPPVPASDAKHD